jgi:PAS domain S-box-containing protein
MISVLYVDDEPSLLEITKLYLEQTAEFKVTTALSARDGLKKLDSSYYDAVVADYQMPSMDGIGFLKEVRSRKQNIPFILFTGRGREEVVIQAIDSGADFYLQKGGDPKAQFAELVHKIRQAVSMHTSDESLRRSEEKYRSLFEDSLDGLFITSTEGKILDINRKGISMFGYDSKAEMLGLDLIRDVASDPEEMKRILPIVNELGSHEFDGVVRKKSGVTMVTHCSLVAARDEKGVITTYRGIIRDITERRLVDQRLRESERTLRLTLEALRIGIWDWDVTEDRYSASPVYYTLLGYEPRTGPADRNEWMERVHPDDREFVREQVGNVLSGASRQYGYEARIRHADGTYRWAQVLGYGAEVDADGKVTRMIGIRMDISGRKEAERALHESERQLRAIADNFPDFITRFDREFRFIFVNPAVVQAFGIPAEQFIGKTLSELPARGAPGQNEAMIAGIRQAFEQGTPGTLEARWQTAQGDRVFEVRHIPEKDEEGRIVSVLGITRDITDEKRAEEALQESEQRYRSIIELNTAGYFRIELDGRFREVNDAWLRMHKYSSRDEIIGKHFSITQLDRDLESAQEIVKSLLAGRPIPSGEFSRLCRDGSVGYHTFSATPVVRHGRITGLEGFLIDITGRRQAEEALVESEAKFRNTFDWANDAIMLHTLTTDEVPGRFTDVNQAACRMLGYTRDELLALGPGDIVPAGLHHQLREIVRRAETEESVLFETRLLRKDGSEFPAESSGHLVTWDGKRVWISHIRDITDRKRAEEALRTSEQQYTRLFEHANDGIAIVQDGIIRKLNARVATMIGYTTGDLAGQSISRVIHPDDLPEVLDRHLRRLAGETGFPSIYTFRMVTKEGAPLWVELNTTVIDWQGRPATLNIIRDITDRKRADDALREANKKLNLLSSVTRHDVLNKLTILGGLIEISRSHSAHGEEMASYLDREMVEVSRIQRIISFTREYQEIGVHSAEWQAIGNVVAGAAGALDPGGVVLDLQLPECQVYADRLLQKVFYNLLDNSLRYGGEKLSRIRVSGTRTEGGLTITVEDDGDGIDPETKVHLFERGFGKNTGLGLFLAKEILEITGIAIRETGTPGAGARFEIQVPKEACRCP